ncbi:hypothetical protein PSHT_01863 [Puccinia striiformis]|uniref:Uncharacterized protein n=2 Tax=Puccinia striiformis TaxID=27350 RepID=A0A2S4WJD1_9BASI|nr:hypothetical protein H4Q26_009227 [Puccinia striiformis f. sp. tritici PST-130]POW21873.1 hypothetical protein PSHT_01863 [Puccinia striiformis]
MLHKRSSPNKTPATKGTRITPKNSRSKKNSAPADKIATTQGHRKREHYHIIINWLSVKKNYVACFGDHQAPKVGQPAKGNINGYMLMAINLRNQSNPKIIFMLQQMKDQFKAYRIKFKKAHTKSLSTGFGLTWANQKAGIKTDAEKLNKMCPLYTELFEVIGKQPDVTPLVRANAEDSDSSSDSSESSESSKESSDSCSIDPLLRDLEKRPTQTLTSEDSSIAKEN